MRYKMLSITIIFITGTIFVLSGILQIAHVAQQRGWATAKGELIRAALRNSSQNGQLTYVVAAEYSYIVEGKEYIGDRISTDYAATPDRARHEFVKEEIKAAQQLTVWYDPSNPSNCLLVRSTGVRAKLPIYFGLILLSAIPAVYLFLSSLQESNTSNLDRLVASIRDNNVTVHPKNNAIDNSDDVPPER